MTQTEYEQNRAECLIAFFEDQSLTPHSVCQALYYAFDRGYALGKVKDLISQDEIDKAAVIAAANYNNPFDEPAYDKRFYDGFKAGANFALGKQTETIAQEDIEKAAEAFATPPIGNGGMFTRQQVKELLVRFAQLLLSKQEKDAGATEALASQWRSVDEELPSNDDKVFVIIRGAYVCGWYNQKYESWEIFGLGSYSRKNASYWMPIPPIPETNTEKQ